MNPLVHVNAISRKKSGRPHCIEQREEHYRVVILVESSRHSSLQLAEFKSLKYERATADCGVRRCMDGEGEEREQRE